MWTSARGLKEGTHAGDKGEYGVTTVWHGISSSFDSFDFFFMAPKLLSPCLPSNINICCR